MADRQHGSIKFYEDGHRYIDEDTGEQLESVTRLIHNYQQPFDSDKHSSRVAKRQGKTQEEVLMEWKNKADAACEFGTGIHNILERIFLAPGRMIIPQNEEEERIIQAYNRTKQLEFLTGELYPEQIVYNKKFKLAGQSDLIHIVPNDQFDVGDHKTNENFRYFSSFNQYLKYPLNHLSDCEFNLYSLQLSTYAYFYEQMTGLKCRRLFVLYFWRDYNIFQVIPMNYMKIEVMMMLKHYLQNRSESPIIVF
jgi:hypothetical protein